VLLDHPRLFSEGVIVPALRSEFPAVEAFRQAKVTEGKETWLYQGDEKRDIAQWIDETAKHAIQWRAEEASGWMKRRLVADLTSDSSLLSSQFRTRGVPVPSQLASQVQGLENVSRADLYQLGRAAEHPKAWELLADYTDFLYYLAGAIAVRSEGVLPQGNLVEFGADDLEAGRTPLSDMQVFFKVFVDIVKAATVSHFPADLLDAIPVDGILDLHHAAVDQAFIDRYEAIQRRAKDGLDITDPERLVLLAHELEEYQHELHAGFESSVSAELPAWRREERARRAGRLLSSIASLAVAPYGVVTGIVSLLIDGLRLCERDQMLLSVRGRIERLVRVLERMVERQKPADKPILLDFVSSLKRRYVEEMG